MEFNRARSRFLFSFRGLWLSTMPKNVLVFSELIVEFQIKWWSYYEVFNFYPFISKRHLHGVTAYI